MYKNFIKNIFNKSQVKDTEKVEKKELHIKEGVGFVFEQNLELIKIGSEEQYSEYIDTIFPDSKVRDIVYHGGDVKEFTEREEGSYFTKDKNYAENHGNVIPVILNIKKGARIPVVSKTSIAVDFKDQLKDFDGVVGEEAFGIVEKNNKSFIAKGEAYVVFKPEQIHILGSEKDIENFKKFVEEKNKNQEEKYLV